MSVEGQTPMTRGPKVSIGLPVYNGQEFLGEALESLLGQTITDFEIIISDNASTDQTEDIVRYHAARDGRIRYFRNERNIGLGRNHNRVFKLARGRYFKWAAADDVCLPDYLCRCIEVLDGDRGVVLCYPKAQFIDPAGAPLEREDPGWDLRTEDAHERLRYVIASGHWVNSIVGLIRHSALAKTRLMPTYPRGDYRLLAELSLMGRFHEIPGRLFLRRLHPQSSSQHAADGTNPDKKWLARYWKGPRNSVALPTWCLRLDQFRIIVGAKLPWRQKLSLLGELLRCLRWARHDLWAELMSAVVGYLEIGGPPRAVPPPEMPAPKALPARGA